jgi:hypothetical protein
MTTSTRLLLGILLGTLFLGALIAATGVAIQVHDTTPGGVFQCYCG